MFPHVYHSKPRWNNTLLRSKLSVLEETWLTFTKLNLLCLNLAPNNLQNLSMVVELVRVDSYKFRGTNNL
ncbi:hypothetical protein Hdeb2414_s0062g00763941 [Helianthus debilis subsp. tardiflorus]